MKKLAIPCILATMAVASAAVVTLGSHSSPEHVRASPQLVVGLLPSAAAAARFVAHWPDAAAFAQTAEMIDGGARPYRLLQGEASALLAPEGDEDAADSERPRVATGAVTLLGHPDGDGVKGALHLEMLWGDDGAPPGYLFRDGSPWRVVGELQAEGSVWVGSGAASAKLHVTYAAAHPTIQPAAWRIWSYAQTLMASDPPVYEQQPEPTDADVEAFASAWGTARQRIEEDPAAAATRRAVAALLGHRTHPWDERLGEALQYARDQGDDELAIALYRRYQPMGRCSMDSRPQAVAAEYAALCHATGRLGCFLQLHAQIIADQFNRVAWSTYGERATTTHAEALAVTGVDIDHFLLGLLFAFHTDRERPESFNVGPWRLARAVVEAERVASLRPILEAAASDGSLDDWNRLRATLTLAFILQRLEIPTDEIADTLAELPLSPPARAWVARELRR